MPVSIVRRALAVISSVGLAAVPILAAGQGAVEAGAAPASVAADDTDAATTLWYDTPATSWESQALPIGNGALGAMVFGGLSQERLQLNEKSLWTGGPGSPGYDFGNWREPRPGAVEGIQQRIEDEGRLSPGVVAQALGQPKSGYGSYQTLGDLIIDVAHPAGRTSGYRRDLDVADAAAGVRYDVGETTYTREYFASAADGVIVGRLVADEPGSLDLTVGLTTADNRSKDVTASGGRVTVAGALNDNGMRYETQVQVLNDGGTRADGSDGRVRVSDADAVVLVLSAGTDYAMTHPTYRSGVDPHDGVTAAVDAAVARGHDVLRDRHVADHRELFDRVDLDLGQTVPAVPTDELLAGYRDGSLTAAEQRALEVLFFQYGRYLLIASSRDGSLPANLQGVWNNSTAAPWGADYHVNINLQMNYWPAETTNLSETAAPLFDYVDSLVPAGQVSAREMFDNRGWVVHNETTPFGFTGVHDWSTAFWFPEAGAWLAQHYFEHYLFTADETFLRERAYPMMRELAQFWLDELVVDPRDGTLVVSPSYSPEQGDFSAGAAMSQQIVTDLFTNLLEAGDVLGGDDDLRAEVRAALARLDPGTRIGSWGQLQEWKEDWDDPANTHRHVSQLFALHPGRRVSPLTTPELAAAAEVSLRARGDGGTGWSKAWKINFWARLLDGDHAHLMLSEQLRNSTLGNLFDTHPPFQIDGNFGATAGVAEMLLQSQHGVVDVLPALPAAWADGSVRGLRARGDVTVDVDWTGGSPTRIGLSAGQDGPIEVRSDLFGGRFSVVDATTGRAVDVARDGDRITIPAVAGGEYVASGQAVVTTSAPSDVDWGETFPVEVTVHAAAGRTVPNGQLSVEVPDGWSVTPEVQRVAPLRAGASRTLAFDVTAGEGGASAALTAVLTGSDWSVHGRTSLATHDPTVIDRSRMSVVDVDSEETAAEDGAAANVLDGNRASYWHTAWSGGDDPLPHHITLDLGATESVAALRYLPRQNSGNGRISTYQVYLSEDAASWGDPVATGTFAQGAAEEVVELPEGPARYLKLVATGSQVGPWTTAAELNVDRRVP